MDPRDAVYVTSVVLYRKVDGDRTSSVASSVNMVECRLSSTDDGRQFTAHSVHLSKHEMRFNQRSAATRRVCENGLKYRFLARNAVTTVCGWIESEGDTSRLPYVVLSDRSRVHLSCSPLLLLLQSGCACSPCQ